MRVRLIIHERIGRWSRRVRSRVSHMPVRLSETRSASDLRLAVVQSICPVVLLVFEKRLQVNLEDLERTRLLSPHALILVLDAPASSEYHSIARDLGATHVLPHPVLPPEVMRWVERWIPLAQSRIHSSGWSEEIKPELDPWDALLGTSSEPDRVSEA